MEYDFLRTGGFAAHGYDAGRSSRLLSAIERSHANCHLHGRHFLIVRLAVRRRGGPLVTVEMAVVVDRTDFEVVTEGRSTLVFHEDLLQWVNTT